MKWSNPWCFTKHWKESLHSLDTDSLDIVWWCEDENHTKIRLPFYRILLVDIGRIDTCVVEEAEKVCWQKKDDKKQVYHYIKHKVERFIDRKSWLVIPKLIIIG